MRQDASPCLESSSIKTLTSGSPLEEPFFGTGETLRVIAKWVFSLEQSLESLISLNSLESLENGRLLLYFPESGGSPESLESLNSFESLENGLF